MTVAALTNLLVALDCPPYRFTQGPLGDGYYLRVEFDAVDGVQHGRKWYVSSFSTDGEVIQTALKAVLTAAEHEIRETFQYHGRAIFEPHYSLDALTWIADRAWRDKRVTG